MVAGAVVPRDAGGAQDLKVARVEREIIEYDISVVYGEGDAGRRS